MFGIRISAASFVLAALVLPTHAFSFQGSISFTEAEKAAHEKGQAALLQEAAACAQQQFNHHTAFYKRYGISPYYGEGGKFGQYSDKKRRKKLAKLGLNPDLLLQMKPTSCIGLVLTCLGQGFEKTGQGALWKRIKKFTIDNGVGGLALQEGLRQLGWKVLYWNADIRRNIARSEAEYNKDRRNRDRYWGYHEQYWNSVRNNGHYLTNKVDDHRLLLNFGKETPATLKATPFFVGTAHGGYHVFSGAKGQVIEGHSMVEISNSNTISSSPFNPAAGQGPTRGIYHSGLIAVPAQYAR